ncbi:TPA: hypothetical protein ACS94Y_001587 [Salmonella enterica subsp. enterica serovar Kentucky]
MLRYREFQTVRGTGCLREQWILRGVSPLGIDLFLLFLADSGPKKGVSDSEMSAGTPKTGAWRGVVVVRHFVALRDESDALVGCSA